MKLEGGIRQRRGNERAQGRSDAANKYPRVNSGAPADNETADENVVSCLDKSTRRDIAQLRFDRVINIVDLDHSDASTAVLPRDDGRVIAGIQSADDRGFGIIRRRNPGRLNRGDIRAVLPVVIGSNQRLGRVV